MATNLDSVGFNFRPLDSSLLLDSSTGKDTLHAIVTLVACMPDVNPLNR